MDCSRLGYFPDDAIEFPPEERLRERPVAVVECAQEIPCNPCADACPVGAISVGDNINRKPRVDFRRCTGCGLCLGACPGLAIFLIQRRDDTGWVTLPYELTPPAQGEKVQLLDRRGEPVGEGTVEKILRLKKHDRTLLLTLRMNGEWIYRVRGFRSLS